MFLAYKTGLALAIVPFLCSSSREPLFRFLKHQELVGRTDDSAALVYDTQAQCVAPGWQFHIHVIGHSLLLDTSELCELKRRLYGDVLLPRHPSVCSVCGHMKLQSEPLAASSCIFCTNRGGIHDKIDSHLRLGRRRRWDYARVKGNAGCSRGSQLHCNSDLTLALLRGLGVFTRRSSIVAVPRPNRHSWTVHFHLDLVELAVWFAPRSVGQQIVRRAVRHAECHGMVKLVLIYEKLAASVSCHLFHGGLCFLERTARELQILRI